MTINTPVTVTEKLFHVLKIKSKINNIAFNFSDALIYFWKKASELTLQSEMFCTLKKLFSLESKLQETR